MATTRTRELSELAVPGAVIGALAGVAAGGLVGLVGQPAVWAAVSAFALGLPLALLGGGYGLLLGTGVLKPGAFAPTGLYWLVGFPLARLVHEALFGLLLTGRPTPPADVLGFLAYQAMVSLGFAIGFSWLHERYAPHWLRRVRAHNDRADRVYGVYLQHAEAAWRARENRKQARAAGRRTARVPGPRSEGET